MKRLLLMLIILFSVYFAIQFAFKIFGTGHNVSYQIKDDTNVFDINEIYTLNRKHEINNYYFKVKVNSTTFSFQTYEDFNKSDMIIKKIKYFKSDKYECLLPIFRDGKIIFDVMCIQGDVMSYYHDLMGKDKALDDFIKTISEKNYKIKKWQDDRTNKIEKAPITVYPNNILDDHFVGINNYKGIYTINNINLKKMADVKIFNKDIYERPLSAIIGKYYITADYEAENEFDVFFIVDLTSNDIKYANSYKKISFDSYIQGIVGDSMYIFDRNSKKQYELDAKARSIIEIGNVNTGIKYYNNGKWEQAEANDAAKSDMLFKYEDTTLINPRYYKVDKIGNVLSGHYYLYKKDGESYKIYRADVQNPNFVTYLFSTSEIDSINYVMDYVYFSENNEVKYYHDETGVKTLFRNDEFEFNESLFYNVYLK